MKRLGRISEVIDELSSNSSGIRSVVQLTREYFDEKYYSLTYFHEQPPSGIELFAHYLANVRQRRLNPNESFSEAFYLKQYPDVAQAVSRGDFYCGFHHFVVRGRREGRAPKPGLAVKTIEFRSPDRVKPMSGSRPSIEPVEGAAGVDITLPGAETFEPSPSATGVVIRTESSAEPQTGPAADKTDSALEYELKVIGDSGLFDAAWYRAAYGGAGMSDEALLREFYLQGHLRGRRPNPYFDPLWYLKTNADVALAGIQPLFHYATQGDRKGRRPVAYFDPSWYRDRYMPDSPGLALAHFLEQRLSGAVSPNRFFDAGYYLKNNPDVKAAGFDPFLHYVSRGYREGREPAENFRTAYYVASHLGHNWDINPLIHFIEVGEAANLRTAPPGSDVSVARELRRFTKAGPQFETFAPHPRARRRDVKLIAYYLPQFHAFEENNRWWGEGFTEWTNIPRGFPRFVGHYQPRVPRDLGFYDLTDPKVLRRQIELAQAAGVFGFCFYYYWFNGKRLMQRPVDAFLADAGLDMPFCLMWANENWTRRWDGADQEVLIAQDYEAGDDDRLVADFARHMKDPRYIRIDGRPILMLYRPGVIPNARAVFAGWRTLFARNHGEHPLIIMAQAFNDHDPRHYDLDGAVEFPPHKLTNVAPVINPRLRLIDHELGAKVYDYDDVVKVSLEEPAPDYPLIKTVTPSWDNDARREGRGAVLTGSTPEKYEAWLRGAASFARENPFYGERFVCINAWNEWCEGAYLEPDLYFGSAYLNATSRALAQSHAGKLKLLLVGHDAFPSGAQHLLLHLGQLYRDRFGIQVSFLLLDDGKMLERYRAIAEVTVAKTPDELLAAVNARRKEGYVHAVINTIAASRAAPVLAKAGFATVQLVHEAPRIIQAKNLVAAARIAAEQVGKLVFSSQYLADRYVETVGDRAVDKSIIQPQGLYQPITADEATRSRVRAEFGLAPEDILVLNVGYADLRKGFDLFLQMWRLSRTASPHAHFLWVGDLDPELQNWIQPEFEEAVASGSFHHIPFTGAVADYYAACDVFALTSREDPYPSVVLEAISANKPVVVFRGGGGIPELITPAIGEAVRIGDTPSMLEAAVRLAGKANHDQESRERASLLASRFDFANYGWKLLNYVEAASPRISVIVPNYNYQRYLGERLDTIFAQEAPVFEVIVLDDASPDGSLDELAAIGRRTGRAFEVITNEKNSGSVFSQWRKGLDLAKGELVWIAEADDASDPAFLGRLVATFKDPSVVFAFSDSASMDTEGVEISPSYKDYYATVEPGLLVQDEVVSGREFLAHHLSVKNVILNVSSVVWRKSALLAAMERAGDELASFSMAGDWLLYANACALPHARIAYVADPLNRHRRHATSVTHSLDSERHLNEIRRMHKAVRLLKQRGKPTSKQDAYIREVADQIKVPSFSGHAD